MAKTESYIGINKSLLAKYIYGIKTPSAERLRQIKEALHKWAACWRQCDGHAAQRRAVSSDVEGRPAECTSR